MRKKTFIGGSTISDDYQCHLFRACAHSSLTIHGIRAAHSARNPGTLTGACHVTRRKVHSRYITVDMLSCIGLESAHGTVEACAVPRTCSRHMERQATTCQYGVVNPSRRPKSFQINHLPRYYRVEEVGSSVNTVFLMGIRAWHTGLLKGPCPPGRARENKQLSSNVAMGTESTDLGWGACLPNS